MVDVDGTQSLDAGRSHSCLECGRSFRSPNGLKQHRNSSRHKPATIRCPFGCTSSKEFISVAALAAHIEANGCSEITRRQFNELAYGLDPGGAILVRHPGPSGNLTRNQIRRNLQRARRGSVWKCAYCRNHAEFPDLDALKAHLKSPAHDVEMYRCSKCDARFKTLSGLGSHVSTTKCNAKERKMHDKIWHLTCQVERAHRSNDDSE